MKIICLGELLFLKLGTISSAGLSFSEQDLLHENVLVALL